jgi:uncharacterized membrane protein YhaH (DUF805 family)
MHWYFEALRKYAVFSGRSLRAEYWVFFVVNFVVYLAALFLDIMAGTFSKEMSLGLASGVYALFVLLPSIAVSFRRLHDTNRSAWWLLLAIIPILGPLALFVIYCLEGTPGDNKYGADPSAEDIEPPALPEPPAPPPLEP